MSSSTKKIEFTWNEGLAYIFGVPTLLFTPMFYWQYDNTLFGSSAMAKMFVITGIGGTLSFALFAGRRRWLIGALLGLVAGLGAAGAHLLYAAIFHRETMYDKESALVCLAGAGIPMVVLAYILKKDKSFTGERIDS
jgi:nitrate/nitrite transporter NarK